jgi:hypothetical protein
VHSLLRFLPILLTITVAGCATARNYLQPDGPVYEATFGRPDAAGENPSDLRVVTFNVEHGKKVAETIELLHSRPDLAILGRGAETSGPRWSILRSVPGWVE